MWPYITNVFFLYYIFSNWSLLIGHPFTLVTLDEILEKKKKGGSAPPPPQWIYNLNPPVTITVQCPVSHVCCHAYTHQRSPFQEGMWDILSKAATQTKASTIWLYNHAIRICTLQSCFFFYSFFFFILPGSTLSFLGPLHNPRRGFRQVLLLLRSLDVSLWEEGMRNKTKQKNMYQWLKEAMSPFIHKTAWEALTITHLNTQSAAPASEQLAIPSLFYCPWHSPPLSPPTYSSSLPLPLRHLLLFCQAKCTQPLYLSAHYFLTFSLLARTLSAPWKQISVSGTIRCAFSHIIYKLILGLWHISRDIITENETKNPVDIPSYV